MESPSQTLYLDTLLALLPVELQQQVQDLCNRQPSANSSLEQLVRFLSDAEPADTIPKGWVEKQREARSKLSSLGTSQATGSSLKRPRNEEQSAGDAAQKRSKTESADADDSSRYIIHSISVSSPVRKKVDLVIGKTTVKCINPTSSACEFTIPISSLRRLFLLPTRGKQKPHWTVVILSSDTIERSAAGKGASSGKPLNNQIIFGLDATITSPLKITDHEASKNSTTLPKGTEVLPTLLSFLSQLPNVPTLRPSLNTFKSSLSPSSPGIEGYLGAKSGSLWFFPDGILWEGKPCEFWALEDLKGKSDGVRIVTATGRMCSLFITRKSPPTESNEEDDGEDIGEETQFSMIDGKEQEGINSWVRKYRHLFGKTGAEAEQKEEVQEEKTNTANAGPQTILQLDDRSDDSDEDFEASSVSEAGASSSDEDEDEDGGKSGSADEDEAMVTDDELEENVADEEEALDPAKHPLMRPGAMPKMSKAAIDMVVGMVEEDMVGDDEGDEQDELDED